jgi:DNA polymerase elongation subunit (family B)
MSKKPVVCSKSFKLIDFQVYDERSEKKSQFAIQMFGVNETGETCSITVNGYKPFFYVKVGDNWTDSDARALYHDLSKRINTTAIISAELVEHKKLYGYTAGKLYKFVKLTFENSSTMNRTKRLWYNENQQMIPMKFKGINMELYESAIPPLLRYFHIHNISPSGWIQIFTKKATVPSELTTTCDYEYVCTCDCIKPLPEKETRVPYKICSFDIEASSSHGDFPMPIKTYKRLASNLVDAFQKHSPDASRAKMLLERVMLTAFGYDKFDDIDLVYPKYPQSRDTIVKMTERLLVTAIKDAEKMKEAAKVNTISAMYTAQPAAQPTTVEPDEEEDEAVIEDDAEEPDSDDDEDDDEPKTFYYKKYEKPARITAKATITDVLFNTDYTRDQKLKFVDDVMSAIYPELEGDKVTFIGSTFMKYGDSEPYLNHCLVLGSCDPVDGAVIESVNRESDLLLKWAELIQTESPDIIIGYNIFGFDYDFMFRRAQENHCEREFLMLSRKKNEICAKFGQSGEITGIENAKVVLASGEYDLKYFKTAGRLQIDMYTYFRRDFNLSSYKLDDVAGQYIGDDIKKITTSTDPVHGDVTELHSKNLTGLNVNDFLHIEVTGFSSDYYANGRKFRVLDIRKYETQTVILIGGHYTDIDTTKSVRWGMAKDDVTPQDIFRLANGSSADRAIVAKYCLQDCNLVHHLARKIDVMTGYVEMARICSVPISFLIFRGQGIKLTSYVGKKCREKNTLMPDLDRSGSNEGYEGAIVLPPKCAMYMDNPVACVDYASLYPSAMISQKYSHDTKVWTKEYDLTGKLIKQTGDMQYDNLPGVEYIDIEFDTYRYLRPNNNPVAKAVKTKSGKMICRWAQSQDAIMPAILEELLKARSDTRKMAKNEKDPFMQNILDKRQLGYKVTANSLYGQCGAKTSTFYEKDIAASTTATGRSMITYAKRMIEEVYGNLHYETGCHGPVLTKAEYVYGDSVANYTPVYVRVNSDEFAICTIEDLGFKFGNNKWCKCVEEGKQDKEFCELSGIETWTEKGWTKLHRVIRHELASHKKMVRILTHTGIVDVTDDHSLIKSNGEEISPKDVSVGTELLHHSLPASIASCHNISVKEARIMGFFFGDGSCGSYDCPSGKKNSWALNNASLQIISEYIELCNEVYVDFEWRYMDTIDSSGVYKISPKCDRYGSIAGFVEKYRNMMYCGKAKVIPKEILMGSDEVRQSFWEGLYDADGDKDSNGYVRIDQKNQISAAHICWLANSLGWKTSLNTRSDKPDIYRVTMTKKAQRKNPNAIKKMNEIVYTGFVYDLTTENHHFAAGIGSMIVHNTDSVFFTFNLKDPVTGENIRGKKALEITIEIAQDVAHLCSSFLKAPMDLTYEKTLMPFVLLSKKRYFGMLYETDPNKGKLKYMGLSLKRRDACDYLKDTYGGILNLLVKQNNLEGSIKFLNDSLNDLIAGKVPMDKLAITRALRSDYKNPNQIAHKVLANRIGERDPGNKPKPGDRVKYLFVVNDKPKALMGERIETPEFILSSKVKIDYTHYITNQLMKPLQQLFGLAVELIWEHQRKPSAIKTYKKDIEIMEKECCGDWELYMKKKEKYCSAKVKTLLFDKVLNQISNEKNKMQPITNFFR